MTSEQRHFLQWILCNRGDSLIEWQRKYIERVLDKNQYAHFYGRKVLNMIREEFLKDYMKNRYNEKNNW